MKIRFLHKLGVCIIFKFLNLSFRRLSSIVTLSLFLFIFSYPISLNAQQCIGSYTLTSQAEIDVFNCATVTGDLRIRETNPGNITNLNGLSELTSVGGYLSIGDNDALTNVDGLAALTSVGGPLEIYNNDALTNVDGLAALTSAWGYLLITNNDALMWCCGLYPLLTSGTIGGEEVEFMIFDNVAGCNGQEEIIDAGPCLEKEAEAADFISGKFEIGSDPNASGGLYVWAPNGSGSKWTLNESHRVEYSFTVEEEGYYRIKGKVYAPNDNDDSFYAKLDGEPSDGYLWDVLQNTTYSADYVSDRDGEDPVEVCLQEGTHTVGVFLREDGTRLDTIGLEFVRSGSCL